jgi:hypothetical protein
MARRAGLVVQAIIVGFLDGIPFIQVNVVSSGSDSPAKEALEDRQEFARSDLLEEIDLMLLLLQAHLVQYCVVVGYPKGVEVLRHNELLAYVAALEPSSEIIRHEPTDKVAA